MTDPVDSGAGLTTIKSLPGQAQSFAAVLRSLPRLLPVVENLSEADLADLEASVERLEISGGAALFREGDPGEDAFIIVAGRLGVFVEADADMRITAQMHPGEIFGELALICREPRTATVVALRDSELIRIPGPAFLRLMQSSRHLMQHVIKLLADRLKRSNRRLLKDATRTIAIVPIDEQALDGDIGDSLLEAFSAVSPGVGFVGAADGAMTGQQLDALEEVHELVIYFGDRRASQWSDRCLRQADRVIFVANAGARPDGKAEQQIATAKQLHRAADLMIVNEPNASLPSGGTPWLQHLGDNHVFHVRRGARGDFGELPG